MSSADSFPEPNLPRRFSVLLSVHRPPTMLPCAIETVLAQSLADFELLIIGDGAPEETLACARAYAARDARLKVLALPKGSFTGTAHRHTALAESRGRYVAHIGDDDLWFPNHLEEMEKLLSKTDFGHTINVLVACDGSLETLASDLGDPAARRRQLTAVTSLFAEAVTGYRIEAYRRLPEGWTEGRRPELGAYDYPDLSMWRKFLRQDEITCGTRMAITALVFASDIRKHMSLEERGRENRHWRNRLLNPVEREEIVQEAWRSLMRDYLRIDDDRRARLDVIDAMNAQFNTLETLSRNRLQRNSQIDFSARGNSFLYTGSGWSFPEAGFRWTDGKEASIRVQLGPLSNGRPNSSCLLRLRASAFGGRQRVVVLIDGKRANELTVEGAVRDYDIDVHFSNSTGGVDNEITFELPDAHSPASLGLSPEVRELGIAVASMTFLPSERSPGMGGS
jgi:glycosyltransferase involved in cell wall biosynthesis